MSAPRILGMCGVARSGKDTVADYLVAKYGFVKHSFATPIRQFVAHILGTHPRTLERTKERPIPWLGGKTPRYLMQTVGTEWGRGMIDPDLWVKSCFHRAQRDIDAGRCVVICDVRFPNEADAVHAHGGQVWAMNRPGAGTASAHASEAVPLHLADRTISNPGSVAELYAAVDAAMAEVAP